VRQPGVGVGGDRGDLVRQLPGGEVGKRDGLQHGAQVRAHRDPDVAKRLRRAGVLDLLGALAANVGYWALDGSDHLGERDLLGRLREPVAPFGTALALDEAGVLEVEQDVLEELKRDLLCLGDPVALLRRARCRCCELRARA
jgi:hypothetical protein